MRSYFIRIRARWRLNLEDLDLRSRSTAPGRAYAIADHSSPRSDAPAGLVDALQHDAWAPVSAPCPCGARAAVLKLGGARAAMRAQEEERRIRRRDEDEERQPQSGPGERGRRRRDRADRDRPRKKRPGVKHSPTTASSNAAIAQTKPRGHVRGTAGVKTERGRKRVEVVDQGS